MSVLGVFAFVFGCVSSLFGYLFSFGFGCLFY